MRRRDRELAARRLAALTSGGGERRRPAAISTPGSGPAGAAREPYSERSGAAWAPDPEPAGAARAPDPEPAGAAPVGSAARPETAPGQAAAAPRTRTSTTGTGWVPARAIATAAPPELVPPDAVGPVLLEPAPAARTLDALRTASELHADGLVPRHGGDDAQWQLDEPAARVRRRLRWSVAPRTAAMGAVAVLLVGGAVALHAAGSAPGAPVALPTPGAPTSAAVRATEVVVDVVGEVTGPGVVRLPGGSRVVDAVAAAGGATSRAELSALNLARVLVDGEQIVVPRHGAQAATKPDGPSTAASGGLVDVNTADAATLDTLPGIGPVLAQRIVDQRGKHPFSSVDELADVPGIGPSLLTRLRPLVRT